MTKRKHKIKRFMLSMLFGILLSGTIRMEAFAKTDAKVSDIMDLTGIMRDSEGDYIVSKKYVTREEFAQMLIQASAYGSEVESTRKTKLFRDVDQKNKKAAYIQIAVSKGYMSGYLGGKFQPKKAVILKEAVYATLKLLGYSDEDFPGNLSDSRYSKFKELGLGKDIDLKLTDKLTESDCEKLFYNILNAKQKSGEIYARTLGFSIGEDGKLDYAAMLDKESEGPVLIKKGWEDNLERELSSYEILRNNKVISADAIPEYSIAYYAEKAKKIWIYDTKVYGCLDNITSVNSKPQELSVAGTNYTVEKPDSMKDILKKSDLEKGMMAVLLLGRNDKVSYVLPISSLQARESWKVLLNFPVNQAVIYKNGNKITSDEINISDVLYYSKELMTIWVYDKKAYGVLETISPSVTAPEQIIVAGKTYTLPSKPINSSGSTSEKADDITENVWGIRLRENGIQEGDNVVVLFGYNGEVADICTINNTAVTMSGYVIEAEDKVVKDVSKENQVQRTIRMVDTQGIIREFPCDDKSIAEQSIVEVRFESGRTIVTKVTDSSANIVANMSEIKLASDARILEVNKKNYAKLTLARLNEVTWNAANVAYCKLNTKGEITDLILKNTTDAFYQYVFLKKLTAPNYEKGIYNYQLTLDINHQETVMSIDDPKWNMNPGPKAIQIEDNKITDMKDLYQARISSISGKQAYVGSKVCRISDDVLVYYYKNGEYFKGSFDDISSRSTGIMDAYMEKDQGPVRIIVVSK